MTQVLRILASQLATTAAAAFSSSEQQEMFDFYPQQQQQQQHLRHLSNGDSDDEDDTEAQDPNALGTALSYIFLFFLIFGLSATVEIKNLKKQLQNRFAIGTGVAMQFLFMPVLGFLAVMALKNQPGWTQQMGVSLLVVTSSPGGSYSNWWCSTFNADLALSVAMTTVSSLLSIAMLPANLFLYTFLAYGASEEESVVQALDFSTIFLALGVVLSAIISGLLVGYKYDNVHFHKLANRLGTFSGILLVLFSLFISSGADGAENNFWNQDWAFYIGVAFPCLVGISLANIISRSLRLDHPETVAISIECCYQNTGIATSVAIAMYEDKEERAMAVAVPLFYGVVEAVAICLYCFWAWKVGWTKAPADERFCTIISKTYEVAEEDQDDENLNSDDDDDDDHLDDMTELGTRSLGTHSRSEATVSSRFADERSLKSSNATSTNRNSKRVWFWQRWFGGDSSATAAAMANSNDGTIHNLAAASPATLKAVDTTPVIKNGKKHAEPPSPHAPLMLSSTLDTSPSSYHGGTESMVDTLSSAASPSSLAAISAMAFSSSPSGGMEDCEVTSGCTPTNRDRTFTVETSASSNPPPTPGGKREMVTVTFGDDHNNNNNVHEEDVDANPKEVGSSAPTIPGFFEGDRVDL